MDTIAFIKDILPQTSAENKLKIPRAFWSKMRFLSNNIIVRDRYENLWHVEVVKEGGEWYLAKGWAKLYEENSLEPGDTLAFYYKGNNMFDFRLFGQDACEKRGVGGLKMIIVKEEEKTEDEKEGEVDEENEEDGSEFECSEETHDDDDDDDDDYNNDDDDDDDDNINEQINIAKHTKLKSKSKTSSTGSFSRSSTFGIKTIPKHRRYVKSNIADCYGEEIFKSGLAPRPKNPYFVTRCREKSKKSALYIPNDVIKDYNLTIPENIFLVDKEGRKFGSKIKEWKDGRLWITRGWRSFCNVNHVYHSDVCICEFVQEGDEELYILVHVVIDGVNK